MRVSVGYGLSAICLFVAVNMASGVEAPRAEHLLIISAASGLAPGNVLADRMLFQHGENFRLVRFPSERYPQILISQWRAWPHSAIRETGLQPVWQQYRWYIIGAIVFIFIQSLIIVDLLLQRRWRRGVEAELRDNQELIDIATSAGALGLWSRDLENGKLWVNGAMRFLSGLGSQDELRFGDLIARVHPDERARGLSVEGRAQAEGWLQTVKRPIIESDGSANQVLGASTDITQRKQAELELREKRSELAHVARISMMGELAASLAHELNQPLTAILSNAQAGIRFLSSKPADLQEVREILQDIVKDNSRAGEVIRRMRSFVKKEAIEFAALDLAGAIRDVAALVHSDAVFQNVKISLELDDNLPTLRGDKVQLQQVLLNLLLNAFDAMKECAPLQREVKLRAESHDRSMIKVTVSDRGSGLSTEKLDKIFQPFYTTKREGLGMGLSICRSIIEAHGGRLWAENNPDLGATFYFTVPVAKSDE